MAVRNVFLTGATGTMGMWCLNRLLKDTDRQTITILARNSEKNRRELEPFTDIAELTIRWGDLTNYGDVKACVENADIILHVGAFVSPAADYYPEQAFRVNYGSTRNIIRAIYEAGGEQTKKLVYIGTVAQTGDCMPPIHWGRVGDPLKPSVYDYYAVSKIASERAVIESGLKYWVSLRQTGIIGPAMSKINDAIMFHNCLDNVLEYVSDRDSGTMLQHLCTYDREGKLPDSFWCHIYNIGGGASCRTSTWEMYQTLYGALGIKDLSNCMDSKWYATRNFHGQYYLDSDKLEKFLRFRKDSMKYYYDAYLEMLGGTLKATRVLCRLPFGEKLIGSAMKKKFLKLARSEHGTVRFIENDMQDQIAAYWGSQKAWEAIAPLNEIRHFTDWDSVIHIDHGYDESKPESELSLEDIKKAAEFRGGICLSDHMATGNWREKLRFRCAFGHEFSASPRLVLEGGHWCDRCERESWNYYERAKRDPFFAQVWTPLHPADEPARVYPKIVSELDVKE